MASLVSQNPDRYGIVFPSICRRNRGWYFEIRTPSAKEFWQIVALSFLILATWDFDNLKGAWPLQKSHILHFRSCIFSEMRSRFLAKRYTIWWSYFLSEPSPTIFYSCEQCLRGQQHSLSKFCEKLKTRNENRMFHVFQFFNAHLLAHLDFWYLRYWYFYVPTHVLLMCAFSKIPRVIFPCAFAGIDHDSFCRRSRLPAFVRHDIDLEPQLLLTRPDLLLPPPLVLLVLLPLLPLLLSSACKQNQAHREITWAHAESGEADLWGKNSIFRTWISWVSELVISPSLIFLFEVMCL